MADALQHLSLLTYSNHTSDLTLPEGHINSGPHVQSSFNSLKYYCALHKSPHKLHDHFNGHGKPLFRQPFDFSVIALLKTTESGFTFATQVSDKNTVAS